MKIRLAKESDAKRLLEIYSEYVKNTAITFEYEVPSVEEFEDRIRNISKRYPYLVLEDEGRILGYAYAGVFKGRRAYDWSVETTVYVDASCKGSGYGRMLYEELEHYLRLQHVTNLYACIAYAQVEDEYLTNDSPRFHEHMGYQLVGTYHNCAYKFERWYDMVWMEKVIGDHTVPMADFIPFFDLLKDRSYIFLGSSVTLGMASGDYSFVDELAATEGIRFIKEAVSGTTLVDETNENGESYITRMKKLHEKMKADGFGKDIDSAEKMDGFICQLSTNDASRGLPVGELSESFDLEDFDTHTITGAMEYVIAYAKETWECPVYFYTGTKYDSDIYEEMIALLYKVSAKWQVPVLDLWNDEEMNQVTPEDYTRFMQDPVHPLRAGYVEWWTPKFATFLKEQL